MTSNTQNNAAKKPAPRKKPAPQILREIAKDARQDPEKYLKETVVPEGGE